MFVKRILAAAAAGCLAFGAAACGDGSSSGGENADGTRDISVILDWEYRPNHMGMLMAVEEGIYEESGLNVSLEQGRGSASSATLVAQGNYDLGHINTTNSVEAMGSGLPLTVVSVHQRDTSASFVGLADNVSLTSPESLKGLTIGSTPGGSDGMSLEVFQQVSGIDESELNIAGLDTNAKTGALLAGEVDVVSGDAPAYNAIVSAQGFEPEILRLADMGVPLLGFGFTANVDFADENQDLIVDFVEATREGFEIAYADMDAACTVLTEKYNVPGGHDQCVDYANGQSELEMDPAASDWGSIQGDSIEDLVGLLDELGLLDEEVDVADAYRDFIQG